MEASWAGHDVPRGCGGEEMYVLVEPQPPFRIGFASDQWLDFWGHALEDVVDQSLPSCLHGVHCPLGRTPARMAFCLFFY